MKINVTTLCLLLGSATFAQAQTLIDNNIIPSGSLVFSSSGQGTIVGNGAADQQIHSAFEHNAHAFCNDAHNDDWQGECELDCWKEEHCGCNDLGQSGNVNSQVRTVSQGAFVVPAYEVVTNVDCYTESSNSTTGHESQQASCDSNFHVTGTLGTHQYHCASGSSDEDNTWEMTGSGHCALVDEDEDTHCPCHVGCKALGNAAHDGDFCAEEDDCEIGGEVTDAEEDIEQRINHQIDKAIADILSEAVERCISTSLQHCIEIW